MNDYDMHNDDSAINRSRLTDRQIDELIGICKGILFDGIVSFDEAISLSLWFKANPHARQAWPGKPLYQTLLPMLANNQLSPDDEKRLLILLNQVVGCPDIVNSGKSASTNLPLCDPAPKVVFKGSIFVITGNLAFGSRKKIIDIIQLYGGEVVLKTVRKDTNYLVIGDIGSTAWMHSTHGRKIEKAQELREQGTGIGIISEAHFIESLQAIMGLQTEEQQLPVKPKPIKTPRAKSKVIDDNKSIGQFFPAFMDVLERFNELEKKNIKTCLYASGVELYHCFQNGKPQTMPSFAMEFDEDNEKPWVVYGLSTPLLFDTPHDALLELLRLGNC